MLLGKGGPQELGGETGAPPLKRRYSAAVGSSSVKMVANRHRNAAYYNKHLEMSTLMTLNSQNREF